MAKIEMTLYFGFCIPVRKLAEVLCLDNVSASICPLCKNKLNQEKMKYCSNCGSKLDGSLEQASDLDVFNVLSKMLGNPPPKITFSLYNGYACIGYELAKSSDGAVICGNNPQYKPWKEMIAPVYKYVNKEPLSSESHLLQASFFAVGG